MKILKYYLKAAKVFTEKKIENNTYILIDDGKIADITKTANDSVPVLDLGELSILPGFLDLHIHGREGADIMDATPEAIETISISLAKHILLS